MSTPRRNKKTLYAIGQPEVNTQRRVIQLFRKLGYRYLGKWDERTNNRNVETELLRAWLAGRGYAPELITQAIEQVMRAADDQGHSLYDVNREVYRLLRYGAQVKPGMDENTVTVHLIEWEPDKVMLNDFAIAEEVTVQGTQTNKRPDLVLYVNGVALGVLELKNSRTSVGEGIRQNVLNQRPEFIQRFFTTMQFVMAGNDTEGLRYGTTETSEKYYLTWKEDAAAPAEDSPLAGLQPSDLSSLLDQQLAHLCSPARFLEIIHDFTVFDRGEKKLCRPNQYFGVRAAQKRVRSREGGIIWHTQGSGKSLTMVWLAKWIREHVPGARVLILTDRTELDKQIKDVFLGVGEPITKATSGQNLLELLNAPLPPLLCSLIHKFPGKEDEEGDIEGFIAEMRRNLPANFQANGDFYVFIDECHRTQSGKLHEAMKGLLPNAMFIGFTGTPLLRSDKQKSIDIFGPYIHTYKYDEAVKDQVVLDLCYEARDIDQHLRSPEKIDAWFENKTRGLTDSARAQLKKRWGTMQKVLSSRSRLEMIVADIRFDMDNIPRLNSGGGTAMLVTDSIYQACILYELFVNGGFDKCAIVTSYKPSTGDIRTEATSEEGMSEKLKQYEIYQRMLKGRSVEAFEEEVKDKFIHEPGQMKLLIVVDKLLTGFDAPSATYLYIDKQMRDHGLFQAICRVNRLDGVEKTYGYIIDYKDLFKSLERSIHDYTSGALDGYERADVEGLLKDRLTKRREDLEEAREAVKALCEPVAPPHDTSPELVRYFCGDSAQPDELNEHAPLRMALYKFTSALLRAYANLASELPQAGYNPAEITQIKAEVDYYTRVRAEVKQASGDVIDLKQYEPAMRYLLDTYIRADDSTKVSAIDDIPIVQLLVERGTGALNALPPGLTGSKPAMAEAIENNLRRLIIDETPINPAYYGKMSQLLDTLIQERKQQAQDYQQYLERLVELARAVKNPDASAAYAPTLNTPGKRALFDNLNRDEQLALAIDQAVRAARKDEWRGNIIKERQVRNAIKTILKDEVKTNEILEIVKKQHEY